MTDVSEQFLKTHKSAIIQKTRDPMGLADKLHETEVISNELYGKIKEQKFSQEQMREIYLNINSKPHFDCVYEWLKKNEPDMLEELEKSDNEAEAPPRKRSRDSETHQTELPDLKMISTFAKLETWVAKNSQKLISDLEGKLGEEGLEKLKKELKDKESKNNLVLNAYNIDEIRKNKGIDEFLNKMTKTKFPKLTLSMFFKKSSFASSKEKTKICTDHDEPMDTIADELNSSGHGSHKSDQSVLSLTLNEEQAADEDVLSDCSNLIEDNNDVLETHFDEMDGKPKRLGQSPNVSPNCPNEPIIKTETPLGDTYGGTVSSSDLLLKNSPVSAFDNMSSKGTWDVWDKITVRIIVKDQDTAMPAPGETQDTVRQTDGSSTSFLTSPSGAVKDQLGESLVSKTEPVLGRNKKGSMKENKLKKKNHINKLLCDWASRQCDGSDEEIKNIFDQISIINMAEHREYPCFTAENVRVYKNPKTCESQIIFIADEKMPKTSADTMVHYHMFVCDLQKAILLGPKDENEQEIKYEEGFIRINKCKRFIFEVFAPTLAVFKKIQEELNSVIQINARP
ncbi:uncharacterized protein Hap1MRO34_001820 isoform 1-T2 [Clarias gariepinus]|uniref:uncharacterized protein LOC128514891 n=1 Tax=Clarias gariepinus TaxID=13013 RepID=UPI00234DF3DB|nr:uncharacterized protein LOC128514891 [Clarias gariepinus]XP_053344766.1 uncharacterized protein LOC128514891 [Clarias gariepinus]